MKCLKCGTTYDDEHVFCPQCGEKGIKEQDGLKDNQDSNHKLVEAIERKLMDQSNNKKEVLGPNESRTAEQIAREVEAIKPLELSINPEKIKKVAKKFVKCEDKQEKEVVDENDWLQELLESNQLSLWNFLSVIKEHLKNPVAIGKTLREKMNYKKLYATLGVLIVLNSLITLLLVRGVFRKVMHTLDSLLHLWLKFNIDTTIPYMTQEIGWKFFLFNVLLDLAIVVVVIVALTLCYKYVLKIQIDWRKIPECFWIDFEILAITKLITFIVLFISPVAALLIFLMGFFIAHTLTIMQITEELKSEPKSFYLIPMLFIFITVMTVYFLWCFLG